MTGTAAVYMNCGLSSCSGKARRKDKYMKQKKTTPRNPMYERQFHDCSEHEKSIKDVKDVFDGLLDEMAKEMDKGFITNINDK